DAIHFYISRMGGLGVDFSDKTCANQSTNISKGSHYTCSDGQSPVCEEGWIGDRCNIRNTTNRGVMGNEWTSVRDPTFFRLHKFIDNTVQIHKKMLPQYNISELSMDGVEVMSIEVYSRGKTGQLQTFMSREKLNLYNADAETNNNSVICIIQPHSNHYSFEYNITVNNTEEKEIDAYVRIYLAPKEFPINNTDNPNPTYETQRRLWALMDRFNVTLKTGINTVKRNSCESAVTYHAPKRTMKNLYARYKNILNVVENPLSFLVFMCGLAVNGLRSVGKMLSLKHFVTPYYEAHKHYKTVKCVKLNN
ncbi:unnamed protein product, partial [Meganyctiphanes norvegica]